jgi:hypothetical protein
MKTELSNLRLEQRIPLFLLVLVSDYETALFHSQKRAIAI